MRLAWADLPQEVRDKAVSPAQNPSSPDVHRREAEVLRTLSDVPEVPELVDAYDDGVGWP